MEHDLFSAAAARAARDEGIAETIAANESWHDQAIKILASIPHGWVGIADDARPIVSARIGEPKNCNSWGALFMAAIRRGLFRQTGEWIKTTRVKSHARKSAVMIRT